MSYFTIQEEQQKMFTQLPKALLYEDLYKTMSNDSKILYSFLVDRVSLSVKNGYVDDFGRVFIKCSEITMAEILNKSEKTVRKFKKELIDKDLLEQADAKNDKTKYYVKQPKVTVSKLEDYIKDFLEVVEEKTIKEKERNKEYRLKKAQNKVANLKAKLCNGKNDRSIENTELQDENSLKPLETLATVKTTDCEQSKLPFSNNDFSNTDFLGMYVCTGEPAYEKETAFIQLAKDNQITFSPEVKEMIMSYEEVFSYELYEYIFFDVLNKYRNGKVNNFEKYLLSALDTQSSKRNFTLTDYVAYKADFNKTNYPRNQYVKPNQNKSNNKPVEPKAPEVKEPDVQPEEPKFVPSSEPNPELEERILALKLRQEHNLTGVEYLCMSVEELKAVIEDKKQKEMQVNELMETYNKQLFDVETRRRFAMQELGLI